MSQNLIVTEGRLPSETDVRYDSQAGVSLITMCMFDSVWNSRGLKGLNTMTAVSLSRRENTHHVTMRELDSKTSLTTERELSLRCFCGWASLSWLKRTANKCSLSSPTLPLCRLCAYFIWHDSFEVLKTTVQSVSFVTLYLTRLTG